MARKTFISYKYSDVVENKGNQNLRDRIICSLGADARFYQGENGYTKDISDRSAEYIKSTLKDMIYNTSVTIVIVSPNMKQSDWIEWELSYSLRNVPRGNYTSRPNGIVAVVQRGNNYYFPYLWAKDYNGNWNTSMMSPTIAKNQGNKKYNAPWQLSSNYITIVTEDEFLRNPNKFIEEAHLKCENNDFYY